MARSVPVIVAPICKTAYCVVKGILCDVRTQTAIASTHRCFATLNFNLDLRSGYPKITSKIFSAPLDGLTYISMVVYKVFAKISRRPNFCSR